MAHFIKHGNVFTIASEAALDLHKRLPAGTYVIKYNQISGEFYFETIDNFDIAGKLYGNVHSRSARILHTFATRDNSTGVMLTGEKGSGKTLLAKNIAVEAMKLGYPILIVNTPFCGDKFNTFMQTIDQPCVVMFDEYEKVYDSEQQEQMLTLLDGVFPSKKLFLLTCNDKWKVNEHMRNRPGRVFYLIEFGGLESEFIREYCEDHLHNKDYIDNLCTIAGTFEKYNFDMLKATVEEMNRFDEPAQEALSLLNAKPEFGGRENFKVKIWLDGQELPDNLHESNWYGNPLASRINIDHAPSINSVNNDELEEWQTSSLTVADLVKVDDSGNRFVFNSNNCKIVLARVKAPFSDWYNAL